MDDKALGEIVLRVVLAELAKNGERFAPVTSSNRHVHLSQGDVERLFGAGYQLTRLRDLQQPGQYACKETLELEGPKGKTTLRVVGPARKETQIELSYTDCHQLGIAPVLRMSGETVGTPGCTLLSGSRRITLSQGVMVAKRHLHLSPEEAKAYGLRDGDVVALEAGGDRGAILENLVVRSGEGHRLEAHIDRDEANAIGVADGQLCRVHLRKAAGKKGGFVEQGAVAQSALGAISKPVLHTYVPPARPKAAREAPPAGKTGLLDLSGEPCCLISEETVLAALRDGYKQIRYGKGAVLTPLAKDTAGDKGIELIPAT